MLVTAVFSDGQNRVPRAKRPAVPVPCPGRDAVFSCLTGWGAVTGTLRGASEGSRNGGERQGSC